MEDQLHKEVRRQIGKISSDWLDTEANLDRWEGTSEPLAVWERRVLMARWAAEAWRRVCAKPVTTEGVSRR